MTALDSTWQPPLEFDEYRLVRPLGQGAMGQVFLAQDTLLDRMVAVKVIASVAPDDVLRERFRTEARAIARVRHANVVEVYCGGTVHGRPYLVSEFVRGESLDRQPVPLPWQRVLGIGISLARGLAAAHRRGVLHRDIKPANAMLTEEGDVKLLDFGVAKLLDAAGGGRSAAALLSTEPRPRERGRGDATMDAVRIPRPSGADGADIPGLVPATGLIGTPRYMAPEIWREEPATARSDVYSLGVMLYELCCGATPHPADTLEALREAVLERPVVPLARKVAGVDEALAALIDRCLARAPDERFPSAEALRDALEALQGKDRQEVSRRERPYPGLHAYRLQDRTSFFGRDVEVRAVLDRLRSEPLVVVAGDSGAGKSSLCRAGVLPGVLDGAPGSKESWAVCELFPGRLPFRSLISALASHFGVDEAGLVADLRQAPGEVGRWVRAKAGAGHLVVFLDQLEEAITLGAAEELEPFARALESLAGGGPRLRVLATARGDFLARLAALPGLGVHLAVGLYLLPRLAESGLREAVLAPARGQGFRFESEDLVDTLVAAGTADGGLPLLQFALSELWERRDHRQGIISRQALDGLGGVEGALARYADGVLQELRPGQRTAARSLLLRLVLAEGTRARRSRPELLGDAGAEDAEARAALEAMVRSRLVLARESSEEDGAATYELAHEALVRSWGTLRGWLANDEGQRVLRQRLERARAEWNRLGRPREHLWTRRQLAEAAGLDERSLRSEEREFLRASRRVARRRRLLGVAAVLSVPLTAVAVYGGLQLRAWQARERDVANALAAVEGAMARAAAKGGQVDALRTISFRSFDEGRKDEAEATWSEVLKAGAEEAEAHDGAISTLDRALARDGSQPELRQRLAEVLYRNLLVAERDHREPVRALLQRRLDAVDDGREYQDRLREPAVLRIETEPGGAEVQVEQVVEAGEGAPGRMSWALLSRPAGGTPVSGLTLPPGSYRLRLGRADRPSVLYPVLLRRGERLEVRVPMPAAVPEGYAYVAPGRFLYGSAEEESIRINMMPSPPIHQVSTGGFLIARHEVTYGEWIAFLQSLPLAERARRRPRGENYFGAIRLDASAGGGWELVIARVIGRTQHSYRIREGARLTYLQRDHRADQDWLRFPVSGISWDDSREYLAWMDRTGRLRGARFCTEPEWERAARGADGREYPHGNRLEPEDANFDLTYGRGKQSLAYGPDEVGSHPASDSPFGVADMAGNVWEWVVSGPPGNSAAYAGGGFYQDRMTARSLNHGRAEPAFRWPFTGLRACAPAPPP